LAGDSPEEVVDAFLKRIRATLSCITTATAYASYATPENPRSLTLYAQGQEEPGRIRLLTHNGQGELLFRLVHEFTMDHVPNDVVRGPFKVKSSFYQYRILDYEDNEIIVYDWHPSGASSVTTPHLHVSAARSVVLKQRVGSQLAGQKTYLGNFHLPTARVFLEDVVELLIREFIVDPLRSDWEAILQDNREAIARGRTW
jgi:hypothetical protein